MVSSEKTSVRHFPWYIHPRHAPNPNHKSNPDPNTNPTNPNSADPTLTLLTPLS